MQMKGRSGLVAAILCVVFLITGAILPLYAQVATARIAGTVTDPTGAVVPGVSISLTNVNTGIVQNAMSNSTGIYVFSTVMPGTYTIRATSPHFEKYVGENIQLHVQDNVSLNITLKVQGEQQQVTVTD